MMRSLFAGVSSLKAHQTRMDVIGNNIANVNTVGFKSSRVTFSDMLSQTSSGASAPGTNLGGINPKQIGLGASVESVDLVFTDGSPQNSGKNTDIALSGNGLFVLKNGDSYYYSRDGAFEFDTNGSYVMPGSGLYVQGWNATDGVLNTNAATENIVVKSGQTMEGTATTAVNYAGNVNAAEPTIQSITYTAGSTGATPAYVIEYREVERISVSDARKINYDPRTMTLDGNITASIMTRVQYLDANGETQDGYLDSEGNFSSNEVSLGTQTYTDAGSYTLDEVRVGDDENTAATVDVDGDGTLDNVTTVTVYKINNIPSYSVSKTVTPTDADTETPYYATTLSFSDGTADITINGNDGTSYNVDGTTTYTDSDGATHVINGKTVTTYEPSVRLTLSDGTTTDVSLTDSENNKYQYTIGGIYPSGDATTITQIDFIRTPTNVATTDAAGTTTSEEITDGEAVSYATYPSTDDIDASDSDNGTVKVFYNDGGNANTMTEGTYRVGQTDSNVVSINVDGTNVIAATLTLSDGSTQKVTSGFYALNHGTPVTTVITVYDSEGQDHAVSLLIDKDKSSVDNTVNEDARALARVLDDDGNTILNAKLGSPTYDAGGNIISYNYTDADGNSHVVSADRVVWDNRWRVYMAPNAGDDGAAYQYEKTEDDSTKTTGYLNVATDSNGNLYGSPAYIYFTDSGSYSSAATQNASLYLIYSNGNGAAPTTANIDFSNITQYAGSTTAYGSTDGNAYGILQSVSIDASGIITGTYSNGILRTEAQIAVAQFVNSAGLTKTGTSLYQQSNNSGEANIKTLDAFGLSITPSALEMSNVELASELADMIVTQRGFQSNSKIITVADEMLETIINMKR